MARVIYAIPALKSVPVKLNEQDLMEIMVDLVEMQKSPFCAYDRRERIRRLLEEKIDPAVKTARIG